MPAIDIGLLLEETKCYACFDPAPVPRLAELGLLNRIETVSMAAISTNVLMEETKCYACYGASQTQLIELGLLRRILLGVTPGADVSPQALIDYSKCYACYGASMVDLLRLALLDQIAQA